MVKMKLERLQNLYSSSEVKEESYYHSKGATEQWFRNIEFEYGHIDEVVFENVNFRHCTFYKCDFARVHFKNCNFNFCEFTFSTIDACSFEDCNFCSIKFYYTKATGYPSSNTKVLKFTHCNIVGMDLCKANVDIVLSYSRLSQYNVFNSSFYIISKGITSIENGDIVRSSFDIFIDKPKCKIAYLNIDSSNVTMGGVDDLTKDTMIIKSIIIRKSTVTANLSIDSEPILNYIYCLSCYLNDTPYTKYPYPVNVGPIGNRGDFTTYFLDRDVVKCGCWKTDKEGIPTGTLEEFESRVNEVYGENGKYPNKLYHSQYMNAITYFKLERDRYLESLK